MLGLCLGMTVSLVQAQVEVPDVPVEPKKKSSLLGLAAKYVMGTKGGDKLFYAPVKGKGRTPDYYGITYEEVFFRSADETKLNGWFVPAREGVEKAKGTIVFSHGNYGKMSNHLGYVDGLITGGYNVFLYDYRGYGLSDGEAEKEGIIADVVAAFRYIKTRKDIDQKKILSVSHSLGGAKSIAALVEYQPQGLRGIVVMNTFSSYRKMALKLAGNAANYVVTDTYNPVDLVKKLPKVPLLVIHAENDDLIPCAHGEEIFLAANQPKTMMKCRAGGHNSFLRVNEHENEKNLLKWLDKAVK